MLLLAPLLLALSTLALAQDRLVRFGPGAHDTAHVSAEALAVLRHSPTLDRAHPALAGVDRAFLDALAARAHQRTPGFIDITDNAPAAPWNSLLAEDAYPAPDAARYPELADMFARVDAERLGWTVGNLSAFPTRYYGSPDARAPAHWLRDLFAGVVGAQNVVLIENSFNQPNVIAAIPRADGSANDEVVVIGAHLDSINSRSLFPTAPAPGADDDASGVAVAFQALQILTAAGWRGQRRIEVHAYGGEEGGLGGSARTASAYRAAGTRVRGMVEFEMVAYQKGARPAIAMTDDTSPALQAFVAALVPRYVPAAAFRATHCGYGCSDHDSWVDQGYDALTLSAAGPNDPEINPYYHTAEDTLDKLNMTAATVFVKTALAFVVELSERYE
ncbi:Zn-dependent exopeptidase [Auricularia subglabra TFB-10046 SS5]|nr:Zn-dependent exopeptidase [Auricularia subglabra TFB-10046 SS5]